LIIETPPAPQTNTADPFASVFEEQKKLQYEKMQKEQAAKLAQQNSPQPGGAAGGMTPNMLLQMMQMMQNQAAGGNQQNNAMMLAAMQNMMQQMSLNNQNNQSAEAPKEEPKTDTGLAPLPDKTNGAFKSLFNDAATSSVSGSGPTRHSDLGGAQQTSNFGGFGGSPAPSAPQRTSEPANPFGNFGTTPTPPPASTEPNNMFSTPFSNSGWSGGDSNQTQAPAQPSSNPFDSFSKFN